MAIESWIDTVMDIQWRRVKWCLNDTEELKYRILEAAHKCSQGIITEKERDIFINEARREIHRCNCN